jgi:hypothetical protein
MPADNVRQDHEHDQAASTPQRLVETVTVFPLADGVLLVQGHKALKVRGSSSWLQEFLDQLRIGIAKKTWTVVEKQVLRELEAYQWLTTEPLIADVNTPWAHQIGYLTLFGPDALTMQNRILSARIGVIGVGGIGALVAQHLVAAGVRNMWLVDHDLVALHNLNRQYLYGVDDIGQNKVIAAKRALQRLAPDLVVEAFCQQVEHVDDLVVFPQDLDLLIVAADTPASLMQAVWAWASSTNVAFVGAAVGLHTGYWGPLLVPAQKHCWHCFELQRQQSLTPIERTLEAMAPQPTPYSFGPSNAVIAALLGSDIIQFLATGQCPILGRRGYIQLTNSRISFLDGVLCQCRDLDSSTSIPTQKSTVYE